MATQAYQFSTRISIRAADPLILRHCRPPREVLSQVTDGASEQRSEVPDGPHPGLRVAPTHLHAARIRSYTTKKGREISGRIAAAGNPRGIAADPPAARGLRGRGHGHAGTPCCVHQLVRGPLGRLRSAKRTSLWRPLSDDPCWLFPSRSGTSPVPSRSGRPRCRRWHILKIRLPDRFASAFERMAACRDDCRAVPGIRPFFAGRPPMTLISAGPVCGEQVTKSKVTPLTHSNAPEKKTRTD